MQTNHASALRGMSIAVVIIAGLTILACIIGAVFLGVGGSYLANMTPDMWEYYLYDDYYGYGYSYGDYYYGFDGADMAALMALLVGIGGIALFMAILFTVPALIAGILGMRNYNDPAKLNLVFGWSLTGAITGFLTGNIATMVLLIIMCVFAHKDKQLAAAQSVMVAPVAVAPVAGAPVAPTTQPAQPAQPMAVPAVTPAAAPVAVPVQPLEPVSAVAVETATPITESAEPAAEPSALVQEEALEAAEETKSE